MRVLIPLLAALALLLPGRALAVQTIDLAFIIGNNHHLEDDDRTLSFADDDALMASELFALLHPFSRQWVLVRPQGVAWASRQTAGTTALVPPTLEGWEQATEAVAAYVANLRLQGRVKVRVFFHFSGHGEREGLLHLEDSFLPKERFRRDLARLGADQIVALLDGCYLADVVRGEEGDVVQQPSLFMESDLKVPSRPAWLGVMGAATAVLEPAWLGNGLLTTVALTGLRGPADLDGNLVISFDEWSRYVTTFLGRSRPNMHLVTVAPRGDPLATVVDLRNDRSGGVTFSGSFPKGHLRVLRDDKTLAAELMHRGDRPTTLRLAPGHYTMMLINDAKGWEGPGIPASMMKIEIDQALLSFRHSTPMEPVALVIQGSANRGVDTSVKTVAISERTYLSLQDSPFRSLGEPVSFKREPLLHVALAATSPQHGLPLTGVDGEQNSANLRLSLLAPIQMRGRFQLTGGPAMQYGAEIEPSLNVSEVHRWAPAYRHELRLGAAARLSRLGRNATVGVELGAAYAPSLVLAGGEIARDPEAERDDLWRFVYLRNLSLEAGLVGHVALSEGWELGPAVRLGGLRVATSPDADEAAIEGWALQLSGGLEFRRRPLSQ